MKSSQTLQPQKSLYNKAPIFLLSKEEMNSEQKMKYRDLSKGARSNVESQDTTEIRSDASDLKLSLDNSAKKPTVKSIFNVTKKTSGSKTTKSSKTAK